MAARSPMPEPVGAGSSTSSWRRPQSQELGRLLGWRILGAFPLPQIGVFSAALALGLILVVAGVPALVLLPLAAAGAVAGGLIPRVCIDNAATHTPAADTPAIDDAVADNAVAGAERLDEAVFAPRWKLKGAVYPMGRGEVGVSAADCRAVPEDRAAAPAQHLEPPAVRLGDPAPWLNTDEATAPLGLHREQQAPEPAVADRVAGARPPERWLRPVPLPPDGPVWVRETRQPAVADGAGRVGGARPPERWLRPVPLLADGLDRAPLAPKRRRSCWGPDVDRAVVVIGFGWPRSRSQPAAGPGGGGRGRSRRPAMANTAQRPRG